MSRANEREIFAINNGKLWNKLIAVCVSCIRPGKFRMKGGFKMAFGTGGAGCGGGVGAGIAVVVVIILLLIAMGIVF